MTDNHRLITTDVYTTTPTAYLKALARVWFGRYGVLLVMPVIALAVLGAALDLRLIIVDLTLVFVVTPMIMTLLYFNYMLAPEARRAILPHSAVVDSGNSLTIKYHSDDDTRPAHADEVISWSDVIAVRRRGATTVFILRGPRLRLFLIPDSVIKPLTQNA